MSKLHEQGLIAFESHKLVIKDLARLRKSAEPKTARLEEDSSDLGRFPS